MRSSLFFLIFLCFQAIAIDYQGQTASYVEWSKIDYDQWLDYQIWKDQIRIKDQFPQWHKNLNDRRLIELMGRVLDCVGECRVYRGEGYALAGFRSSIKEGDEVVTGADSYLWIFLYDGTMVRLSPGSSVSFRELNIGKERNFIHARINSGNVLWLGRNSFEIKERKLRETDTLFIPLTFYEASNPPLEVKEEDLYDLVASFDIERNRKYLRLNKLIGENNQYVKQKLTDHFLVMPNGTVFGQGLRSEFIVLSGGESFVKNRSHLNLNEDVADSSEPAYFLYRGYENKQEYELGYDTWYQISSDGRNISELDSSDARFGMGEYLTKRIPTILIGRELLIKRYSHFVFEDLSDEKLAVEHGYRQWTVQEHQKRIDFLKEYTRRIETTNLLVSKQLQRKLEQSGEKMHGMYYDRKVYIRALDNYIVKQEMSEKAQSEYEILNSTSRKLWKRVNAIR